MTRILLLCFIHGFKGSDNTFKDFPRDLKEAVEKSTPDDAVESVVYPKYETKGELAASTEAFLEWLKERVVDLRKRHLDTPWPPGDRNVGVVLVAHSMGGFVASDALFRILDDRRAHAESTGPLFPLIQGILCFDTPFNGLARPMFVYGAFSNYQKVSNVFNVMTALSAAAPASLSRLASSRAATSTVSKAATRSTAATRINPAWKTWQLVAMRTGTVGAIAAGGVAAYMHRQQILAGMRGLRSNLTRESVAQGYQSGVGALGQGLAYVNRGAVGQSFAWLADHFTFVGALLKQAELDRRLARLAALRGVGVRDVYVSMGENGVWSGGYFVPERTFCAVPVEGQSAAKLFHRWVVNEATDEIVAHMSLFKPEQNKEYGRMTGEAAKTVVEWFHADDDLFDDPKLAVPVPEEMSEAKAMAEVVEGANDEAVARDLDIDLDKTTTDPTELPQDDDLPDESPVDIAAAASLVPLPDDDGEGQDQPEAEAEGSGSRDDKAADPKQAYMRHLFDIAQQTGTSIRSYFSPKLPAVDKFSIPKVSMPAVVMPDLPNLPNLPSMPSVSLPGMGLFSKKVSSVSKASTDGEAFKSDEIASAPAPGAEGFLEHADLEGADEASNVGPMHSKSPDVGHGN